MTGVIVMAGLLIAVWAVFGVFALRPVLAARRLRRTGVPVSATLRTCTAIPMMSLKVVSGYSWQVGPTHRMYRIDLDLDWDGNVQPATATQWMRVERAEGLSPGEQVTVLADPARPGRVLIGGKVIIEDKA